ncbi:hypothetical protein BAU07_24535 [Bordetella flabilis]|uniref:Uncharacterized protein n=2 Tax=Bordetella flabilis TaxID=463014 RepID=A0A193GKS2_9BORD|nr:hypothetical protein BAU07_24535 [Bordetella flabilis]
MYSLRLVAAIGLAFAAPACLAARPVTTPCPSSLQIRQVPTDTPSGWTVMPDPRREPDHRLQAITFFSGEPANMVALAPDTEKRSTRGYASSWHFQPGEAGYWIGCNYTDTNLLAVRKLADNISQCDMMQYFADRRRPGGAVEVVCY